MSFSENNSFDDIMRRCLNNQLLNNVDKRVGSMIYDAMAPLALELAEAYAKMDIMLAQTFFMTATGEFLDRRVADNGMVRQQATVAKRIGQFWQYKVDEHGMRVKDENGKYILEEMEVPVGSRFTTVNQGNEIYFVYTGKIDGMNILECEQEGTVGNEYMGTILPVSTIAYLVKAEIVSTYVTGRDTESDDELRNRQKLRYQSVSFGGNIADYVEKCNEITGVGETKVFPAWQTNGTVLLCCVDESFNPLTPEFIEQLQDEIDPPERHGGGEGIAPIGHYVTVTTPVRKYIAIQATLVLETGVSVEEVRGAIEANIESYFAAERRTYTQGRTLVILRARIIQEILRVSGIINAIDILLDGIADDVFLIDQISIDGQFLPYVAEVTLV